MSAAALPSTPAPPPRWKVWLLATSQRTPIAPAAAALGPVLVAAAAGVLLAIGEGRPWPAAFTPPIVLVAHLLVDQLRALHLPAVVANLLGLGAAALALTELTSGGIEARLLFGAHLLAYLTWIVSLQRKTFKVCWSLVALSALQVAVASVLTAGVGFGFGLAGYLLLNLWALSNLAARWPDADRLSARTKRFAAGAAPTVERASVVEPGRVGPVGGRTPLRSVVALFATAAVVGGALFMLTPRIWLSRRPPIDPTTKGGVSAAYTGFSGEVRLGAIGEILESSEPAFEVQVDVVSQGLSLEENDVAAVFGTEEPLFHGTTLDRYEDGYWSDSLGSLGEWQGLARWPPTAWERMAVERYWLKPLGGNILIHGRNADAVHFEEYPNLRANRRSADGILVRPSRVSTSEELEYRVFTLRPPDSRLSDPGVSRSPRLPFAPLTKELRANYLQLPAELPAVAAAAEAAIADLPPDAASPEGTAAGDGPLSRDRAIAEAMTSYLRDSGQFAYSLDLSVQDPTVDAVEDFLANKRVGHCEYFATSLALMLRQQGVPSRVLTGFKGGDLNRTTRRLEVQQRHAHAWVEAYVDGKWTAFDPTPAGPRTESVKESAPLFGRLGELTSAAQLLWVDYVVRMNLDRQRITFGQPVRDVTEAAGSLFDSVSGGVNGEGWRFDGRAGALAALTLLALVGLGWAARGLLARQWRRRQERRARESAVRFWRRFTALVARRGVTPAPTETPAEFAARARTSLNDLFAGDLAGLPTAAATDLYAVRFGGVTVPPDRLSASLDQLEARLRRRS